MALGIVSKGGVRELCNDVDDIAVEIRLKVQAGVDRATDGIKAELNSTARELSTSEKVILQIPQVLQRLSQQIGPEAPIHVKNIIASGFDEINAKVQTVADNLKEVQVNVTDVSKHTENIDKITDAVDELCKQIDSITDKYQK